jgi:hypothetical protein
VTEQLEQVAEVFSAVLDRGSFHASLEALPADLPAFRSQLRALGRREGVRVLTHIAGGTFVAYWPEHEPTPIQRAATQLVVRTMWDAQPITYAEALEQVRREQIRAV